MCLELLMVFTLQTHTLHTCYFNKLAQWHQQKHYSYTPHIIILYFTANTEDCCIIQVQFVFLIVICWSSNVLLVNIFSEGRWLFKVEIYSSIVHLVGNISKIDYHNADTNYQGSLS